MSLKPKSMMGPSAGSLKYDILTMLSLAGMHGPPIMQTSMLRLIGLITARYNWRLDELTVGQRDMAKMWNVNERTVKREVKRLIELEILICKRPGVRGRVGAYRLNFPQIARLSEPAWDEVGPDFAYRMRERYRLDEPKVVPLKAPTPQLAVVGEGPWATIAKVLQANAPDIWQAWFANLTFLGFADATLHLKAPNHFQQRYIETHLLTLLVDGAGGVLGPIDKVVFAR